MNMAKVTHRLTMRKADNTAARAVVVDVAVAVAVESGITGFGRGVAAAVGLLQKIKHRNDRTPPATERRRRPIMVVGGWREKEECLY